MPLPERLLADPRYYALRASQPNPDMGLVLAAIATETKIKNLLQAAASHAQQPLVHLVIANPRDVTMRAASLFDKGLDAVVGVSLRRSDRQLYKAVERLFEERNAVAHKGTANIDLDVVRTHLKTAVATFHWLNSIAIDMDAARSRTSS